MTGYDISYITAITKTSSALTKKAQLCTKFGNDILTRLNYYLKVKQTYFRVS